MIPGECGSAKFVMKVDDDAFVNPTVLWDALEHALLHTTSTRKVIYRFKLRSIYSLVDLCVSCMVRYVEVSIFCTS